jgi:hypothetical protein
MSRMHALMPTHQDLHSNDRAIARLDHREAARSNARVNARSNRRGIAKANRGIVAALLCAGTLFAASAAFALITGLIGS